MTILNDPGANFTYRENDRTGTSHFTIGGNNIDNHFNSWSVLENEVTINYHLRIIFALNVKVKGKTSY